jgi:hypothetical protein
MSPFDLTDFRPFTVSQDTAHDVDDIIHDDNGNDQGLTADEDDDRPKWFGYMIARLYHGRRLRILNPRSIQNSMLDPVPGLLMVAGTIPQLPGSLEFVEVNLPLGDSTRMFRAIGTVKCPIPRCPDDWSYDVVAILVSTDDHIT